MLLFHLHLRLQLSTRLSLMLVGKVTFNNLTLLMLGTLHLDHNFLCHPLLIWKGGNLLLVYLKWEKFGLKWHSEQPRQILITLDDPCVFPYEFGFAKDP